MLRAPRQTNANAHITFDNKGKSFLQGVNIAFDNFGREEIVKWKQIWKWFSFELITDLDKC